MPPVMDPTFLASAHYGYGKGFPSEMGASVS